MWGLNGVFLRWALNEDQGDFSLSISVYSRQAGRQFGRGEWERLSCGWLAAEQWWKSFGDNANSSSTSKADDDDDNGMWTLPIFRKHNGKEMAQAADNGRGRKLSVFWANLWLTITNLLHHWGLRGRGRVEEWSGWQTRKPANDTSRHDRHTTHSCRKHHQRPPQLSRCVCVCFWLTF